jgi:hypothetical protein
VQLGHDVEVSRTAVELAYDPLTWRERLLALMTEIKGDMPVFARPGAQKDKTKEKA